MISTVKFDTPIPLSLFSHDFVGDFHRQNRYPLYIFLPAGRCSQWHSHACSPVWDICLLVRSPCVLTPEQLLLWSLVVERG